VHGDADRIASEGRGAEDCWRYARGTWKRVRMNNEYVYMYIYTHIKGEHTITSAEPRVDNQATEERRREGER